MSDAPRVPMPSRPSFADERSIRLSSEPMRVGRRFNLDIDEAVLAQIGKEGLAAAVARLGEQVAYAHQQDIERVVHSFVLNREWAEPIIRQAIRESVERVIRDIMHNTALGDALRARAEGEPEPKP